MGNRIQSYPFDYRGAAILSGQEEGAYGWVTVNYLLENFIKVPCWRGPTKTDGIPESAWGNSLTWFSWFVSLQYGFVGRWFSPGRPTVGALDFGGASTQITFATQEEIENKQDQMKLRLYGQEYSLYTHSFLCYGRDQFLKRLLAHIMKVECHTFLKHIATGSCSKSVI